MTIRSDIPRSGQSQMPKKATRENPLVAISLSGMNTQHTPTRMMQRMIDFTIQTIIDLNITW